MAGKKNKPLNPPVDPELLRAYQKAARKADDRMRALERLAQQDEFRGVLDYAYAKAHRDALVWSAGHGSAGRFRSNTPKSNEDLRRKMMDINDFLSSPTSTKTGIVSMYKQRAETLSANYGNGTKFTWRDLADIWDPNGAYGRERKKYSSGTIVKAWAFIKKQDKKMNDPNKSREWREIALRNKQRGSRAMIATGNPLVDQAIRDFLAANEEDLRAREKEEKKISRSRKRGKS